MNETPLWHILAGEMVARARPPLELVRGREKTNTHRNTHRCGYIFSDAHTNSQWIGAVESAATALSHSIPMFTYLLAAMAAMTGPLTLRKPPRLHDVPSSDSVKILRAPGPA